MSQIVFMFPGQGAQFAGMGKDLYDTYPEAKEVFDMADEALGMSLSTLCFEGPDSALVPTEVQQPAILTVSVAAWRVLAARGLKPFRVAGLSLGEYSALVAAGVISVEEAVPLVRDRGRYMQEAVPPGRGAMAAILGLGEDAVEQVCREASGPGGAAEPANYNCPGQIVIAGDAGAVRQAAELAKEKGARRAVMLPVSAPFHSSLMEPAAVRLEERLGGVAFSDAEVPVVSNVDAAERTEAGEFPPSLVAQVDSPVLWEQSVRSMVAAGAGTFIEVGPGRALQGFLRRIHRGAESFSAGTKEGIEELLAGVGGVC